MSAIYAYIEENRREKRLAKQISDQRASEEIVKVRRAAARIKWKDDARKISDAFELAWEDTKLNPPPPAMLKYCRCGDVGGHAYPCTQGRVEVASTPVFGSGMRKNGGVGAKNSRAPVQKGPPSKQVPAEGAIANWRPWQSKPRVVRRGFQTDPEPGISKNCAKTQWRPWQG